jgi:ribosome production factor 1
MISLSSYAFRSTEKVALQEIGPRFTLKLRSLKKGLPAVNYLGDVAKPLEFDDFSELEEKTERPDEDQGEAGDSEIPAEVVKSSKKVPPKADEYEWVWKVCFNCNSECSCLIIIIPQPELETSRRTFFL